MAEDRGTYVLIPTRRGVSRVRTLVPTRQKKSTYYVSSNTTGT